MLSSMMPCEALTHRSRQFHRTSGCRHSHAPTARSRDVPVCRLPPDNRPSGMAGARFVARDAVALFRQFAEREQRFGAASGTPARAIARTSSGDRKLVPRPRRLGEGAIAANVTAQPRERNEDFRRERNHISMALAAAHRRDPSDLQRKAHRSRAACAARRHLLERIPPSRDTRSSFNAGEFSAGSP